MALLVTCFIAALTAAFLELSYRDFTVGIQTALLSSEHILNREFLSLQEDDQMGDFNRDVS